MLLGECLPRKMKFLFSNSGHQCETAREAGFGGKGNGELLSLAEAKFDILITVDKNLKYQQNLTNRGIAILVLRAASMRSMIFGRICRKCSLDSGRLSQDGSSKLARPANGPNKKLRVTGGNEWLRPSAPSVLPKSRAAWASHGNLNGLNQDIFRRNGQPIFHQALEVEPDRFANIRDSFFEGFALCMASRQSRAKKVTPAFLLFLEKHGVRMGHRQLPFQIF
ncbi:MAG: hypothetical protein WA542_21450 [Candidatus Acidiferrum sp.]